MISDITFYRKEISALLSDFFQKKVLALSQVNPHGKDAAERFRDFTLQGKMLRGSLLLITSAFFSNSTRENAVTIAASLELFQSALLIHDDIMDQDEIRRGEKSLYKQYADAAEKNSIPRANHLGNSLAICAGDIGFFLAYELLSQTSLDAITQNKLIQTISLEMQKVAAAQMQDVYFGSFRESPSEKEILSLYTYKTARYTFSLPLVLGGILGEADSSKLHKLEKLGELLGIIFQIKDDELGIFADEKTLGKPIGSDIRENKKTLYYYYLFKLADKGTKEKLLSIFGNENLSQKDIIAVRKTISFLGIDILMDKKIKKLSQETEELIESLPLGEKNKQRLLALLAYSLTRKY